jgi:flagellar P-ring protein precursor FlgI
MRKIIAALAIAVLLSLGAQPGFGARIKDVAHLQGVRDNQLVGYGLVIGLDGTGDSTRTGITKQTVANMLQNMKLSVNREDIDVYNVATVMVTATLPPFAKNGDTIDVVVSSIADADSLVGGTLLRTPLKGPQGNVYAVAQGSLTSNALAFSGEAASVQKNHPTAARIPNGAIIEREIPSRLPKKDTLTYNVKNADFTTISRITEAINDAFAQDTARPIDGSSFRVTVPERFQQNKVRFISALGQLQVTPDSKAKVVVNERTGTIVMGQNVRISKVAVSHGNLRLRIRESPRVSQPPALSGGETREVPRTDMAVQEEKGSLMVMDQGVSIGDVASALNAIGATPRDLISIFQAIKVAGALHAELEIM